MWWTRELLTLQHVTVGVVGDREHVGRHFTAALSLVHGNNGIRVDWETSVWVDYDTKQAGVGLHWEQR